MIEIGKSVKRPVRERIPGTRSFRPKLDASGQPEYQVQPANIWRVTRKALGGRFGKHRDRRLVVGLLNGDLLVLYPYKTRAAKVTLELEHLYQYGLQCKALITRLEKARSRKAKLADRRATARLNSAERRLRERAKRDNQGEQ